MRLLVIGGCGFVGSNFMPYVLQHYGPEMITNLDALTTGRLENVAELAASYGERYEFLHADFSDAEKVEAVLEKHQFFAVIHFAAAAAPAEATAALLERARRHGVRRFLLVSRESPEPALAAAEEVALAAHRAHEQEVVITRATENYGPFQSLDGFVPHVVAHALRKQPVLIPDEAAPRDRLHVEDHAAALFAALLDATPGRIFALSSGFRIHDRELSERILDQLGSDRALLRNQQPSAESGTAPTSAPASSTAPLDWKPRRNPEQALRETVDWYVHNREWWEPLVDR